MLHEADPSQHACCLIVYAGSESLSNEDKVRSHEAYQVITIGTLLLSCRTSVGDLSCCSLAAPPCLLAHALHQPNA